MRDNWADLIKLSKAVSQFAQGDASRLYVQMLDSLISVYRADLETITADNLPRTQAALRQAALIRDLIAGTTDQPPRI